MTWLEHYLCESIRKDLCTKIGCTTCGAQEFRRGLLIAVAQARGGIPAARMDLNTARELVRALADVIPAEDQLEKLKEAVRFVLCEIWYTIGEAATERELEPVLVGSWAGGVLAGMRDHHKARMEARKLHEEANNPERIRERREEKSRLRQQRYAERLTQKKERDRLWREKHSGA